MKKPSKMELKERLVEDFNILYPVGSKVLLMRDFGNYEERVVRGEAYILGGHTAVAFFEGISGCFSIEDRIRPIGAKVAK